MAHRNAAQLAASLPGVHLPSVRTDSPGGWQLGELAGRIAELCGQGNSATLTAAVRLVLDAQRQGEPVVWLSMPASSFYPPDVAEHGVDLEALAVVRLPDAAAIGRAADQLARSGAFGLLVLDLGKGRLPDAQLTRLLGLAQKHHAAILCLTETVPGQTSLGSLVSLRGEVRWRRRGTGFGWEMRALKDKRRSPGWTYVETCRGPVGLR